MIKNYLVRGDCHGRFDWINTLSEKFPSYKPEETAIIILGDTGVNFYLNKTDRNNKRKLQNSGYTFYLVRGNHEQRPELIDGMEKSFDEYTCNYVYLEKDYPNVKYFIDGKEYSFGGFYCLVIGGAYSVDKNYRLMRAGLSIDGTASIKDCEKAGWFPNEQLNKSEMDTILNKCHTMHYDFILSHTCPRSWEPIDLFLHNINQNKVDKSMENWLDEVKDTCHWSIWLFGHYHSDRIERPHVEQYFNDIEDIDTIWNRWYDKKTFKSEWWLFKSPQFYYDDNPYYQEVK